MTKEQLDLWNRVGRIPESKTVRGVAEVPLNGSSVADQRVTELIAADRDCLPARRIQ